MFHIDFVSFLVASFVFSLFWAATGHLLYLFYAFVWRSGLGLLGFVRKAEDPAAGAAGAGDDDSLVSGVRAMLSRYGVQLLGVLGALLAVLGFFWLLGDLVADQATQRILQLGSLLILTAVLLFAGYRMRVVREDLLGTSLMLLGFWMIPIDGWFYEEFILGYSTRSAYQTFVVLTALGTFLTLRTRSRTFGWLTPQCLLAALLLLGYKFQWSTAAVAYVAALAAPGLLALSLFLDSLPGAALFVRPLMVSGALASIAALCLLLGSTPEALPWLPLAVAGLGGGTLGVIAYLVSDLRGVLVLVPYFGVLFHEFFSRFATDYGHLGVVSALLGLALLALERTRRRGAERRRGLDPWCSVPALALLLLALVGDGVSLALLLERVTGLHLVGMADVDAQGLPTLWAEVQRAVFYLSRLDPALVCMAISGTLTAAGLAYLGGEAAIPLLSFGAGIPLALGAGAAVLWLRPYELFGEAYWSYFLVLLVASAAAAVGLRRGRGRPAARALGFCAHLLTPLTYLLLGARIWAPGSVADWWVGLTLAVVGLQCFLHARIAGSAPNLSRLGAVLTALPWPFVIVAVASWHSSPTLPGLVAAGLVVNGVLLGYGLRAELWVEAVAGGLGIGATLLAAAVSVGQGEIAAKLVVVCFGLVLLYAGARSRRGAGAVGLVLLAAAGLAAAPPPRRLTSAGTLAALGAANSDDPLIRVVLRATKVAVPAAESGESLAGLLRSQLGAQSGIDSAAAALQIAATPLRLQVASDHHPLRPLDSLRDVAPRSLDFAALARRLPGGPQLPARAGDALDQVPADYIQLRFASAGSLARILDFYQGRGRAILEVTAPGLALPGPGVAFERAVGIPLQELAEGCRQGVLLVGDPYLGQAPDLVLVLQFPDPEAARAAEEAGRARTDPARLGRRGDLVALGTLPGDAARVLAFMGEESAPQALAREPDFRYASLLPLPGPDGRLFVSEAAVRRLVSARFWIAANRRADCQAELADLEAAHAFGAGTGRPLPADPAAARREAIHRGWVRSGLVCRAGGALSRADDGLPHCAVHGNRRHPRPLAAAAVDRIYREEEDAYRSFQWRYGALYATWIDPISVGLEVTEEAVVLSTAILPVARQPFYRTMAAVARQGGRHQGPLMLPPGADEALASVAVRLPPAGHELWRSWSGLFRHRYYREPSLWRLDSLLDPSPLGGAAGVMLFPGDPGFMIPRERLWKDAEPPPVAAYREVVEARRASAYLAELVGGRGHHSLPGGAEAYGFRLLGHRWIHAAVGEQAVILAAAPERLEELVTKPRSNGVLDNGSAWMRVRPARLWEAGKAYRSLVGSFLGTRCRKLLASIQTLLDLDVAWPAEAARWPQGEPFLDPAGRCPGGGSFAVEGAVVRCSLHGSVDHPVEGAPQAGSPVDRLLQSLDTLETEIAAQDDAIWTRVVLR